MEHNKTVTTICYGKKEVWQNRQDAINEFLQAIFGSDGSEQQRYINIYKKLISGARICTDDLD